MKPPAAVLLDVYETVVACDFERHFRGLAAAAEVPYDDWSTELERHVPALVRGHTSIAEAFSRTLATCGGDPSLAQALVRRDVELIVECTRVFADVVPAIERWRSRGVLVALVSNCVANTAPMLEALGLAAVVDAVVLSCEVGSIKPEPEIYWRATSVLGIETDTALFIDDQARFCAGAQALGMTTLLIDRGQIAPPADGVVRDMSAVDSEWLPQ